MKMTLHTALIAVLLSATTAFAQTAVPSELSYQAIVTDDAGNALAPNSPVSYEITMRIFGAATGGTLLWSERQVTDVFQGRFSIILGQGAPVAAIGGGNEPNPDLTTVFTDQLRFTEITVRENVDGALAKTLAPRQKLVATATAMRAKVAETVLSVPASAIAPGSLNGDIFGNGVVSSTKLNSSISDSEFGWLDRVSSNIQDQLNDKASITDLNTKASITQMYTKANAAGNATLTANNTFTGSRNTFNGAVGIGAAYANVQLGVTAPNGSIDESARFLRGGLPYAIHFHNGHNGNHYLRSGSAAGNVILQDTGGNVGIGTSDTTQARLTVASGPRIAGIVGAYINSGAAANATTHGEHPISIRTLGTIWSENAVIASSDERIKEILGESDGSTDLQSLLGVKITDYRYKDQVSHGDALQKKVIAQQLETVFPQAVSRQTNVVPDIYKKASIHNGWIMLATDLKKGERVRLISTEKESIFEVLEVEAHRFRTDFDPENEAELFVYGREVDDFRTVDYDAVAMLNVSATQELYRRLEAKEKEVEELKARMEKIEQLLAADRASAKFASN
jgi:hypothetical protein